MAWRSFGAILTVWFGVFDFKAPQPLVSLPPL